MARQMDAYGQPAPIYAGQPTSYQTPTMGGYSSNQVMQPDYGVVRSLFSRISRSASNEVQKM